MKFFNPFILSCSIRARSVLKYRYIAPEAGDSYFNPAGSSEVLIGQENTGTCRLIERKSTRITALVFGLYRTANI